jgi:hypothetical protein
MKPPTHFDGVFTGDVPASVFYPGRSKRAARCNSFKPTHETQARVERQRYRSQQRRKVT